MSSTTLVKIQHSKYVKAPKHRLNQLTESIRKVVDTLNIRDATYPLGFRDTS